MKLNDRPLLCCEKSGCPFINGHIGHKMLLLHTGREPTQSEFYICVNPSGHCKEVAAQNKLLYYFSGVEKVIALWNSISFPGDVHGPIILAIKNVAYSPDFELV